FEMRQRRLRILVGELDISERCLRGVERRRNMQRRFELLHGVLQIAGLKKSPASVFAQDRGAVGARRKSGNDELRILRCGDEGRRHHLRRARASSRQDDRQKTQGAPHSQNFTSEPGSTRLTRRRGTSATIETRRSRASWTTTRAWRYSRAIRSRSDGSSG